MENFHYSVVFSNEYLSGLVNGGNYLDKRETISESRYRSQSSNKPFKVLGITEKPLEYDRILVRSLDRFTQLFRIRDKMKQIGWTSINNDVITKLWNFQTVIRGDITYRFRRNQVDWLRNTIT